MHVKGYVDEVSHDRISGWAWNPAAPLVPVTLVIAVDGLPVAQVVANSYRPDIEAAGIANGRCSFIVPADTLALPLQSAIVEVRVEGTGQHLVHSPARLEAPIELNLSARQALVALLDSPASEQALLDRAQFLAGHVDRLLARLSDQQCNRAGRVAVQNRKWRWTQAEGPPPPRPQARALVIDSVMPRCGRDAGSQAVTSHMQSLQRLGFEVTFVPTDMQHDDGADALATLGIVSMWEPWAGSVEEVLRRQAGAFDLIYLHRVGVASRYLPLVRHYMPRARLIYSVADLHSLRLQRQAKIQGLPELIPLANHIRNQEQAAAASCHAVLTHSSVEAAILRQLLPRSEIHVVPWAVPARPTPAQFHDRAGVAFVGSFTHEPNLDAAFWLMDEIMPLVWQYDPAIPCFIAGFAMPEAIAQPRDPRISVIADLVKIDDLLGRVRLTVAPLAFGAGLKGKVLDSMAAGVPCVCTPVAAEGFDLPQPLEALIAGDAAGLASIILRLHSDSAAFGAARKAGLAYVSHSFNETVTDAGLRRATRLDEAAVKIAADDMSDQSATAACDAPLKATSPANDHRVGRRQRSGKKSGLCRTTGR